MKTSESTKALSAAMSKAQANMTGATKSKENPFFKNQYADLTEVIAAVSKPFAENGLSFVQSPGFSDGMVEVTTRIMHESGEWIEGVTALPPTKADAQGYGSAITYARRYGLQAMAGVPAVDDDGNAAVKSNEPVKRINKKRVQQYVTSFLAAIEDDDGLAILQLGDELKDTPEHDAVWKSLDTQQKTAVRELLGQFNKES